MYLHKNWQIQSSCEVKARPSKFPRPLRREGLHKADVPATVVGALVRTRPIPSKLWNKSEVPSGMNYSDKNLLPIRNAGRESISLLMVVSHGVSPRLQERRRKRSG